MANQAATDKKDRNGGGDVTKSEEVAVTMPPKMIVDALASRGPSRFTEEDGVDE